jgi:hypothetical protein
VRAASLTMSKVKLGGICSLGYKQRNNEKGGMREREDQANKHAQTAAWCCLARGRAVKIVGNSLAPLFPGGLGWGNNHKAGSARRAERRLR